MSTLRLVTPLPLPPPPACVLTGDTLERLQAVNHATRRLRDMGHQVIATLLRPYRNDPPKITIRPNQSTSLAPLLHRATLIYWVDAGQRGAH